MSDSTGGSLRAANQIRALFPNDHAFSTPKPEELLQRVITIATNPGDLVLDCFAGSGTTAAVAHKMGRRWVTSELLATTADTFTKPRLSKVVHGEDDGGITTSTARVDATEGGLPEGLRPSEAQAFNSALTRVLKALGASEVAVDEKTVKALKEATKTKDEQVKTWHGGGGFTHAVVGPSMYDVDVENGDVFLSDAAVNGAWSKAVAAQLRFRLTPTHPVFAGVRGRQRLAVIDGVADDVVVKTVVEHLGDREKAVIVAKVVLPGAEDLLQELSPGSRLKKAPRDLFPQRTVR
jgi:hypothetical protein